MKRPERRPTAPKEDFGYQDKGRQKNGLYGAYFSLLSGAGLWWAIAVTWPHSLLVILAAVMLLGGLSIPRRG